MTRREWFDIIFTIYKECRAEKGWADLYECHDQEDRDYFMGLDELYGR